MAVGLMWVSSSRWPSEATVVERLRPKWPRKRELRTESLVVMLGARVALAPVVFAVVTAVLVGEMEGGLRAALSEAVLELSKEA